MKRIGVAVALLLCAVAGLLVETGCARSPQAKRDRYLAAGKRDLDKKDYPRAILDFRNAVQAMPDDAESYYQLAWAYAANHEYSRAYLGLQKALELNPQHHAAEMKLAELLAATTDPELVKQGQERLKKLDQQTPGDSEILQSLALTEMKLGKSDDAILVLEQALAAAPENLASSLMLARAKLSRGDSQGAEDALKQASTNAPKSADAHGFLGEFYAARGRSVDAEAQFQRAIELDPKNLAGRFDLAKLHSGMGKKKEAEEDLKQLASSGDKAYKPVHALFLAGENRMAEALPEFEKLAREDPTDRLARTRLIAAYQSLGRTADAQHLLDLALKKNPKDLDAKVQRGELLEAAGKHAEAERDLTEVLRLRPESAEVHYVLSKVYKARGEPLRRRQELSEVLRLDRAWLTARLELSELQIEAKNGKDAGQILDEAPAEQKKSLRWLEQRNWALWASGDMAGMRKGVDQGLGQGKTPDLLIQDGLWKLQAGNFPAARAALEEALKISPADVRALKALYRSYAMKKEDPVGLQKVTEYASRQPKAAPVQEYLGLFLLQNGDRAKARAAFNAAKAADPQYVAADFSLVETDVSERKLDDARNRLKTILAADNRSSMAYLWMGIIDQMVGDRASALDEFRKSVGADAQNAQALNNLAWLLADYANKPDEALAYAEKARELDPGKADYADTLGWIFYRKGIYASAIQQMEAAASQKQADAVIKYHLAMAYAKSGDGQKGRATFQAALKLNPKLPEAQVAAGVVGESK